MTDFVAETPAAATATTAPVVATTPKPKALFFSRFTMSAPLVANGQARPDIESKLSFGIYRENPRIVVRTNDPADAENSYGKITAAMDPSTWEVLRMVIEEMIKNPVKDIKVIKNFNMWKNGQKFDTEQLINQTLIGRDEDGRIWLRIMEEGRPSPTFYFGPPKYHALINMDKTPYSPGDASQLFARATVAMLSRVFAASMGKRDDGEEDAASAANPGQATADPQKQGGWQQRGGQGGGGWQNRGGGGGGGGFNRGGGGGWQNRNGGGGGQGGGGGWQNRNGGGGGNWQQNRGGQGGGGGGAAPAPAAIANDDITF